MIKITHSGESLNSDKIALLEVQLGAELPLDYKRFLLAQNGGSPTPHGFQSRGQADNSCWIDYFCLIDQYLARPSCDSDPFSLSMALANCESLIPLEALVIGRACRDDFLLIFLGGKRRGQVHLKVIWDSVDWPPTDAEPDREKGIYFVAKSFDDLFASLS